MQKNPEIWLTIYTAAIQSFSPSGATQTADHGLREYNKRFPATGTYSRNEEFNGEEAKLPVEEEEVRPSSTLS